MLYKKNKEKTLSDELFKNPTGEYEDLWPSGAAGGIVTKKSEYRLKYLLFTNKSYNKDIFSDKNLRIILKGENIITVKLPLAITQTQSGVIS